MGRSVLKPNIGIRKVMVMLQLPWREVRWTSREVFSNRTWTFGVIIRR